MQFSSGGALAAALLAWSAQARADQIIVTDVTYTHSAQTTSDSHYRLSPSAETPKDWTKPTDWTKGSVYVRLEVKTKPGDTPTKFQICFEGTPSYACTDQSKTYTTPGTVEWLTPISKHWSPAGEPMNWANGVKKVALILKDTNNGKPQGDPKYVPTDLHVVVALLSEGASYQPPSSSPKDAGVDATVKDASVQDANVEDARVDEEEADAGEEVQDSGSAIDAATARRDASTPPKSDAGKMDDGQTSDPSTASSSDGCSLGGAGASQAWLALLAFAARRRRRHPA